MYECKYYESFGRRPEEYNEEIRTFKDNNFTICMYNNVQLQPHSAVTCGFHVLFYLYQRARSISLNDTLTRVCVCVSVCVCVCVCVVKERSSDYTEK